VSCFEHLIRLFYDMHCLVDQVPCGDLFVYLNVGNMCRSVCLVLNI